MNELLEAALQYESSGFFVLPLDETVKEKKPHVKWKNRRDKKPNRAEIRKWWRQWPNANVGLAVGKYSGMDVLDFDGAGVIEQVEQAAGVKIDQTYSATTGREDGGTHVYYKHNGDNKLKNRAKVMRDANGAAIDVDVRTTDGIVAAPPSIHYTGAVYKWNNQKPQLNGTDLPEIPPQIVQAMEAGTTKNGNIFKGYKIPDWVVRTYTDSDMGLPGSVVDYAAVESGVPEGQRDQLVFQLLCSLRARGAAYNDALQQAQDLGARCDPPFPPEEVTAKIDHVWASYPAGTPTPWSTPPEQAENHLQTVLKWIADTPHPQHGWLDQIQGLIPEDINVVMDHINAKTRCGKRALQRSLNQHNRRNAPNKNQGVIEKLNSQYGWTSIGPNAYIVDTWRTDKLKIMKSGTFKEMYSNQTIFLPGANGDTRAVPLGKAWLENPNRRDFKRVFFHPSRTEEGSYNLYKGFAVQPADVVNFKYIQNYIWHVDNIICTDTQVFKEYTWAWAADMFQCPADKKGVAIVLRGGKGTGKGFFARPLMMLWGPHAMNIINPSQVVGRFNAHLANKILIYIDEAFWTNDQRKAEGVVKGMITELTIAVEGKGVDVILLENFNKFIMASNEDWVIPASFDERRFGCLDINPAVAQNIQYFNRLKAEMDDPGFRPNLLRYLLDYQYDPDAVRKPPNSQALVDQKLKNLKPIEEWWFEYLRNAENLTDWVQNNGFFKVTTNFYSEYMDWCQEKRRYIESYDIFIKTVLGQDSLCPSAKKKRSTDRERKWGYQLPSIEDCRTEFEKKVRGDISW